MDITELEPIVRAMQDINEAANIKRADFKSRTEAFKTAGDELSAKGMTNLEEQSLGEIVGVGKCLQILVDIYPDEMNELTAVVE